MKVAKGALPDFSLKILLYMWQWGFKDYGVWGIFSFYHLWSQASEKVDLWVPCFQRDRSVDMQTEMKE